MFSNNSFISIDKLTRALVLLLMLKAIAGHADTSRNGLTVTVPNGYLNISADDLRLESTGGTVPWNRYWDGQEWKFNAHWESLSQSWKNLTCSSQIQQFDFVPPPPGPPEGSWIWVDDNWDPFLNVAVGTITPITPVPPMEPIRTTPFNSAIAENITDYSPVQAEVDFFSLCGSSSSSIVSFVEGYRRINELYLGQNGRYVFNNLAILQRQPVRGLPSADAITLDAQLSTGNIVIAPIDIPKGFRWVHKEGDWIDYNLQGQVVAYGDSNDNIVWLTRDTNGLLRGVVDANGRVLFTLHYTGQLITEVRDYPIAANARDLAPRSVFYQYDLKNRLISVTDVRGGITQYDYDFRNHIIKVTDPESRIEKFVYNGDTVAQRTAPDGGVTDYFLDYSTAQQQFSSLIFGPVTAAGRKKEEYTHNRSGKLVRLINNGRTDDSVNYDTALRTESHTNARGFTTVVTRNEFEQITRIDYPDATFIQGSYSAQNIRLTEEVDEVGIKTQYDYDLKGNLLKKTEAVGLPEQRVTEYQVNALGQTIQMTRMGRTETNGTITPDATWLIEYDSQGQISKITDPEGGVRQYIFNRIGSLASYTDPLGHTTRYAVDASGNLISTTDALGRIKSYAYDKVGNRTGFTDARGKQTLAAYDAMNRLLQITNPVGGIAKRQYNAEGLPVSVSDEDGRTVQLEFDNFQRLTQLSDALGNQTQFGYNIPDGTPTGTLGSLSMPTEIKYPTFSQSNRLDRRERLGIETLLNPNRLGTDSLPSSKSFDPRGLVKSDTDANGKIRSYTYDALGQLTEYTDALGNKTHGLYDARGNLIQLTDANGNSHKFEYDRNDHVIKEILPLGQATDYSYDDAGNLIQRIDPNDHKTIYTYDATHWLDEIKQYQGSTQLLRTTTFTWDDAYNLIAWIDTDATRPNGQQVASGTAVYDDANRKTKETINYPNPTGLPYSLSYSYQYSLAGKKTQLTWADGTQIDYGYTAHGQLQTVTIPGEGILSVNQFKWNAPASVTLPGGSTLSKTYDGLMNLEGLKVKTPVQQTLLDLNNSYGKRQELTSRSRNDSGAGVTSTITGSFSYDDELQLTEAVIDDGSLLGSNTETFTLDAVGNRTAHSQVLGSWNYDANNRLKDKGILLDATNYEYDEAGSLTRKTKLGTVTQFGYDSQNRLTQVMDGNGNLIARYGYDPFDRRIWKERYRTKDGAPLAQAKRSYYLYADEGLIAESQQEITPNADQLVTASAAPAIITQYGPRPDGVFGTGVLFVKALNSNDTDTVAYYHHDHLGTPIQATDKNGNVVWSANYNVFGRVTITTQGATFDKPTIASNLRLSGQLEDDETGLHYNWHRYYDSDLGRYTSQDPIGVMGGINLYNYSLNNPVFMIDPKGLFVITSGPTAGVYGGAGGDISTGKYVEYDGIMNAIFGRRESQGSYTTISYGAGWGGFAGFSFGWAPDLNSLNGQSDIVSFGFEGVLGISISKTPGKGLFKGGKITGINFTLGVGFQTPGLQRSSTLIDPYPSINCPTS